MTATKGGLVPVLSPLGHLTLVPDADAPSIPPEVSRRRAARIEPPHKTLPQSDFIRRPDPIQRKLA